MKPKETQEGRTFKHMVRINESDHALLKRVSKNTGFNYTVVISRALRLFAKGLKIKDES